ncbi:sulfite exporter TauE/SafE family protein [Marinomonas agarivorans]|nr:sulfite exporter TauE/SafE family protein [Marinomonas agarivorans]
MLNTDILTAFLIGLAGAGHCFGMCGGIISALSFNTNTKSQTKAFVIQLLYHLGRVGSYICLAMLLTFFLQLFHESYQMFGYVLRTIAGTILILMGLYLLGLSSLILYLEKIGTLVWRLVSKKAKGILPIKRTSHAFIAGFIWGWLPCGLVYSSLLWISSTSTNLVEAIYLMIAFGLGTLPAMLAIGLATFNLKNIWNKLRLNVVSGGFMIFYGIWTLPITEKLLMFHKHISL